MEYITGEVIKKLRIKKQLTQKELAGILQVSDKTVSKWENDRGMPDISIMEELAMALGVSIPELLTGTIAKNNNKSANMQKTLFYICPICGNVVISTGEGHYSCCGITLIKSEMEEDQAEHEIVWEEVDGELYLSMNHPMTKKHSISFFAYVTSDQLQMVKLYPEQSVECRMSKRGHGMIYAYCNRHGLFGARI